MCNFRKFILKQSLRIQQKVFVAQLTRREAIFDVVKAFNLPTWSTCAAKTYYWIYEGRFRITLQKMAFSMLNCMHYFQCMTILIVVTKFFYGGHCRWQLLQFDQLTAKRTCWTAADPVGVVVVYRLQILLFFVWVAVSSSKTAELLRDVTQQIPRSLALLPNCSLFRYQINVTILKLEMVGPFSAREVAYLGWYDCLLRKRPWILPGSHH